MKPQHKVNIRPNVTMLSVLRFLEYETWYALAEFVDNSIGSYQANYSKLKEIHGNDFQLRVSIELNDAENSIRITDNAAGIAKSEYSRAFRAAEIPQDTSGLSEFGMGMKSAACWFSNCWTVRTKALGETEERTIRFDMAKIYEDKIEELEFESKPAPTNYHYTVIELQNVHRMPRRKGLGKVRSHLASIYREFLRNGTLSLQVDGQVLQFSEPKILTTQYQEKPYHPVGEPIEWKKTIDFSVEANIRVHGFVAIRETASTSEAGFALFRRGRVVEGSFDNGFRPDFIFGAPNSYRYQRIFGELHLEGFDVTFTKKGIQWDDNLSIFLELLRDDISSKELPLLQQAENYRARASAIEYQSTVRSLNKTVADLMGNKSKAIVEVATASPLAEQHESPLSENDKTIHKTFVVEFDNQQWQISIELSYDPSITEFIEVGSHLIRGNPRDKSVRQIGIRLSLTHPFMVEHVGTDNSKVEPVLRMVAALGLAEVIAKSSGAKTQGEIRRNFNALLSKISNPNSI